MAVQNLNATKGEMRQSPRQRPRQVVAVDKSIKRLGVRLDVVGGCGMGGCGGKKSPRLQYGVENGSNNVDFTVTVKIPRKL